MAEIVLDMQELVQHLTMVVHIERSRVFDVRLWLGMQLIRLGTWVAGLGFETESDGDSGMG